MKILEKLGKTQRKILKYLLFLVFSLGVYCLAYLSSQYKVRLYRVSLEGFESEVDKYYYSGAFDLAKTWYIWLIYIIIVCVYIYINRKKHNN